MSHKTYETSIATFCHLHGMSDEFSAQFLTQMLNDYEDTAKGILYALLENLQKEFPQSFETGESISELVQKISPAFPGKSQSPYQGGNN